MPYTLLILLAIASLPAMANAQIYSQSSASSNSGGNVAGPGGAIETGGASASVTTSNAGGTSNSSVYIRTQANGVVHEESYTSSSSEIGVSVRSTPKGTVIETSEGGAPAVRRVIPASAEPAQGREDAQARAEATSSASPGAAASSTAAGAGIGLGAKIILSIEGFLSSLFRWFR
jgi:hypothetical protein